MWWQLWQAFIGIGARRVEGYYEGLLAADSESQDNKYSGSPTSECGDGKPKPSQTFSSEKWKGQIEKVYIILFFNRVLYSFVDAISYFGTFRICLEHFQDTLH
jgi:hypothetical protein